MLQGNSYTQRFFVLLETLKAFTDESHVLSQIELVDLLDSQGIAIDRRSIKRALEEMQRIGYPVKYERGWYYEHEFSKAELDLLMEGIVCGGYLGEEDRERLSKKIKSLGGKWYEPPESAGHLKISNERLMDNLHILQDAIREGNQVEFQYGSWDYDKKLHPKLNTAKKPKEYIINPYKIAYVNGRYYLIAAANKHNELCHFRVDRILEMKRRKRKVKPIAEIDGYTEGIDLAEYIAQHPYMHSGIPQRHRIRVKRRGINDVLDWFGTDVEFENVTEHTVDAVVVSDDASFRYWLHRYEEEAHVI